MSSEEALKYEGYLAVNLRDRSDTQRKIQGLIDALRNKLDTIMPTERLEGELIAALALELATLQLKYKALLATANAINQHLGR